MGAGDGTVVQNSEFLGNKGGSIVNGFNLSGLIASTQSTTKNNFPAESVTLRDCVSSGNVASTSVTTLESIESIGFSIRYPSGVTMERCVAEDNRSELTDDNKDSTFGFADGIFIFSDQQFANTFSNNIAVRDCKLSRNRVVKGVFGTSSGLRVFDDLCENVVVERCTVTDNRPDADEAPNPAGFFTTGIDLFNELEVTGDSFVMVTGNVIQRNGISGVDNNLRRTNVTDNQIGFHDGAGVIIREDSNCNTVLENTFTGNGFAVFDFNEVSTTLVAGNKGYTNYCGYEVFYEGGVPVPVTSSNLPNFPALPAVAWANVEIGNEACGSCVEEAARQVVSKDILNKASQKKITTLEQKKAIMKKRLALYKH